MKISKEDIELIRKMEEIGKRGYFVDSVQLTNLYNKVLEKRVNPTNCSACLKSRLRELVDALNRFERLSQKAEEASKPEEPATTKEEENKPVKTKSKK